MRTSRRHKEKCSDWWQASYRSFQTGIETRSGRPLNITRTQKPSLAFFVFKIGPQPDSFRSRQGLASPVDRQRANPAKSMSATAIPSLFSRDWARSALSGNGALLGVIIELRPYPVPNPKHSIGPVIHACATKISFSTARACEQKFTR